MTTTKRHLVGGTIVRKGVKKFVTLILLLCVLVEVWSVENASASEKVRMTRLEYIIEVVKNMADQEKVDGTIIDFKKSLDGSVIFDGKHISATKVKNIQNKYGISIDEAQTVAVAGKIGLIKTSSYKSLKSNVTYLFAYEVIVRAHEYLYGEYHVEHLFVYGDPDCTEYEPRLKHQYVVGEGYVVTIEDALRKNGYKNVLYGLNTCRQKTWNLDVTDYVIDFVIKKRISNIDDLKKQKDKILIAKAYLYGYIKGVSDGVFSRTRRVNFSNKPYKTTLENIIAMLTDGSIRYKLSPDYQMLRISTKNMPIMTSYYPYILDSFPNSYYDTKWTNVSTREASTEDRIESTYFYKSLTRTLAERYEAAQGEYYYKNKYYVWPSEIAEYASMGEVLDIYKILSSTKGVTLVARKNDIDFYSKIDEIIDYIDETYNVDYRLCDPNGDGFDKDWIKNQTIITCTNIHSDVSSIYEYEGFLCCKIYMTICVKSDKSLEQGKCDGYYEIMGGKRLPSSIHDFTRYLMLYYGLEVGKEYNICMSYKLRNPSQTSFEPLNVADKYGHFYWLPESLDESWGK